MKNAMQWVADNIRNVLTIAAFIALLGSVWYMKADAGDVQRKFDQYDYRNVSQDYYEQRRYIKQLYEELKYAETDRERKRIAEDIVRAEREYEELSKKKEKIYERLPE